MVMLNALLCALIIVILAAGAYYAAVRWVDMRHTRDMLADEYKRATDHIEELESRVLMLEADRDTQMAKFEARNLKPDADGYGVFGMRGGGN